MSCTVVMSNSSVFSPPSSFRVSSSFFCKHSSLSSSPETLILIHSPSSLSSSSSVLKLRLQKPPSRLIRASNDVTLPPSSSPTISKRKRTTKLDILVATLSFGCDLAMPSATEERRKAMLEFEGDGYSVYTVREGRARQWRIITKLKSTFKEISKRLFSLNL